MQAALDETTEVASRPGGTAAAMHTLECDLWVGSSGVSAPGTLLTPNTLLRVGSVTKTFTAAAILTLVDAGALSLDDTVDTWVAGVPLGDQISVRQLLDHTSGVFNISDDGAFMAQAAADPDQAYTPQQIVDAAAAHGPNFAPRTSWEYSNTNFILLGMIIQAESGSTVSANLRSELLAPLGLDRTFLDGEDPLPTPLAMGYGPNGQDYTTVVHPSVQWTAGSLVAEVADITRWARALYAGSALSDTARGQMLTFIDTGQPGVQYGLGVYRIQAVAPTRIGHPGDIFGFHGMMYYLPDDDAVLSVVVNSEEGSARPHFDGLYQAYDAARSSR